MWTEARERFGAVDQEDITELPQEYKDLERRVDALKAAHTGLMKVAKVYEKAGAKVEGVRVRAVARAAWARVRCGTFSGVVVTG